MCATTTKRSDCGCLAVLCVLLCGWLGGWDGMLCFESLRTFERVDRVPPPLTIGTPSCFWFLCSNFLADDGKYCVTGGYDRTVRLWNPARLDPAHPHPPPPLSRHPSHKGIRSDDDIPLDDLPRALPIQTYTNSSYPVAAVAAQDGQLLLAADKACVVVDMITQQTLRRFTGHTGRINGVTFGPDIYASASYDATTCLWDGRSRSAKPIQTLIGARDSVTQVQVSLPDTALIWTASVDGAIRTYDVRKGILTCDELGTPLTGLTVTHDDQLLAAAGLDGTIRLLEVDRGELVNTYEGSHAAGTYGLECCVTANDTTIVSGSQDGQAVMYDLVRASCVQALQGHAQPVCSVDAHPNRDHSDVILTASYDGSAVVWAHNDNYVRGA